MTKILDAKEAISILDEVIKRREDADKTFQTMETQVRRVIMVGTFSGGGPEAIRNHFKYVQLPTIRSFRGFFNVYTKAVKQMKKNILSFESSDALVRRDFWLMQVPKGLHRLQMSTDQSISNVNKVAASIQDIINIGSLNGTAMTMDIKEAKRHAQQVHQKLSSLDKTNTAIMKAVEAHLNSLGSTVKKAERWSSAGPVMPPIYVRQAQAHFEEHTLHELAPKPAVEGESCTREEVESTKELSLWDQVGDFFSMTSMVANVVTVAGGAKEIGKRFGKEITGTTVRVMMESQMFFDEQVKRFTTLTSGLRYAGRALNKEMGRAVNGFGMYVSTHPVTRGAMSFAGDTVNVLKGLPSKGMTALSKIGDSFQGTWSGIKATVSDGVTKLGKSFAESDIGKDIISTAVGARNTVTNLGKSFAKSDIGKGIISTAVGARNTVTKLGTAFANTPVGREIARTTGSIVNGVKAFSATNFVKGLATKTAATAVTNIAKASQLGGRKITELKATAVMATAALGKATMDNKVVRGVTTTLQGVGKGVKNIPWDAVMKYGKKVPYIGTGVVILDNSLEFVRSENKDKTFWQKAGRFLGGTAADMSGPVIGAVVGAGVGAIVGTFFMPGVGTIAGAGTGAVIGYAAGPYVLAGTNLIFDGVGTNTGRDIGENIATDIEEYVSEGWEEMKEDWRKEKEAANQVNPVPHVPMNPLDRFRWLLSR
ncbi:LXG domain-containing protein [Bacillus sp. FSL W7-1360]